MLTRLLATAAFALVSVSACAQVGVEPYQAGTQYFLIDPPQPTSSIIGCVVATISYRA